VAVALLAAGCGAGSSAPGTLGPGTTVFKAGTGPLVPAVTGPLIGGGKLSLASYRGHVVVLNFWGSWCSVCHEEAPSLAAVARRFKSSDVRFLGVDVADSPTSALAYMRNFRIAYPSLNDPADKIALDFHNTIPIMAFPSTLIISPDDRVAARIIGAVTYQGLTRIIKEAA
jgi:thiol-disulfide isomerase/thioredoxin